MERCGPRTMLLGRGPWIPPLTPDPDSLQRPETEHGRKAGPYDSTADDDTAPGGCRVGCCIGYPTRSRRTRRAVAACEQPVLHQQLQVAIIDVNYSPQLLTAWLADTNGRSTRPPYTGSAWASMPSGPVSASSSAGLKDFPTRYCPTHILKALPG